MEAFSVVDNRHEYAREWKKRTGGPVVGVLCSYVPEELIYAAGALPVRVLGSHEPQDVAEPHIFSMFCPFSRDVLAQGLTGKYDYLDGMVHGLSCIHMRQAFDSWQVHVPTPYSYFFPMPAHLQSPHAHKHLEFEILEFKRSLEEWTGKAITDTALDEAIEVYNRNRRLMKQVYELRKGDPPLLSGVDAMEMVLASLFMDKKEHNPALERWSGEITQRRNTIEPGIRLMVLGSENDDREVLRLMESLGANVVIDDHCTGSRYFWNEVLPQKDRLSAIASRYIDRPPCPSKDLVERRRFDFVLKLAEDYGVQGAIQIQQKFCDPHEFDIPPLKALFEERDIPSLFLELDVTVPVGVLRTRIEAFLEMMQMEELV
ncbi:MAG: 2-hydroxyacyl-CoA dehydratase [Dehalococcoidia bacterium]